MASNVVCICDGSAEYEVAAARFDRAIRRRHAFLPTNIALVLRSQACWLLLYPFAPLSPAPPAVPLPLEGSGLEVALSHSNTCAGFEVERMDSQTYKISTSCKLKLKHPRLGMILIQVRSGLAHNIEQAPRKTGAQLKNVASEDRDIDTELAREMMRRQARRRSMLSLQIHSNSIFQGLERAEAKPL